MRTRSRTFIERISVVARSNKGQGLVEYALILVLIAIVVLAAVQGIGLSTNNSFNSVNSALNP